MRKSQEKLSMIDMLVVHKKCMRIGHVVLGDQGTAAGGMECHAGIRPERKQTFFSMEHSAKLQPCISARLHMRASMNSDLPEFGMPVTMLSSPGTICSTRRRTRWHAQCAAAVSRLLGSHHKTSRSLSSIDTTSDTCFDSIRGGNVWVSHWVRADT